jgi:hypothetical protein
VNVTELPEPEVGETEVTEGMVAGGAVTPSRKSHPLLEAALAD